MLTIQDIYSTPPGGWNVKNPEDDVVLRLGTADSLWRAWAAHRRAKDQPPMTLDEMQDVFCRQLPPDCPTCGEPQINPWLYPDLVEWRKLENTPVETWGSAGWLTLHKHQLTGDKVEDARWLAAFVLSIPCNLGPRYCRQHFQDYLIKYPADFNTQETWLHWSWRAHNEVNARLGKRLMDWDECKSLYLPSQSGV